MVFYGNSLMKSKVFPNLIWHPTSHHGKLIQLPAGIHRFSIKEKDISADNRYTRIFKETTGYIIEKSNKIVPIINVETPVPKVDDHYMVT